MISACVLIRTEHGKFHDATAKLKQFNEVKEIFQVHGRFDVVADIEAPDFESLGTTVLRMGRIAGVVFTETLVEIQARGA